MATQTSTLRAIGCKVDTQSIRVFFSGAVDQQTATTAANYSISAPNAGIYPSAGESGVPISSLDWNAAMLGDGGVVLSASTPGSTPIVQFSPGDLVVVTVSGVLPLGGKLAMSTQSVSGQVPNLAKREVRDVEDAISYPVLTEEVSYRPSSPVGIPTTGAGGIAGPGASNIGQIAMQAVTDVLGWKANTADPKGFLGALSQSFTLKDVEGHVESTWVPRSYAVQTDLGGGITGAQASLYMRAKDALDQSLSLLDGLYPLDPDADPEYVRALREMARSQMTEIIKELGVVGVPSILRINTYFKILLGQDISKLPAAGVQLEPDEIGGTLGDIRQEYGIYFEGNPFNNSVEDEQDITNFRVISDYMTSLSQSWIANRKFFEIESRQPAFFGTQLVLISRQFNVIAETVNEVRFALDSVFIGPNERQTLLLKFPNRSKFPSMYLEDVLDEVDSFVSNEGPRLLRDGGKISVANNILPVVRDLKDMIKLASSQKDNDVPKGFRTTRVRRAFEDLYGQLDQLRKLTEQVEQKLPAPTTDLLISRISITTPKVEGGNWRISIFGNAFDPAAEVAIYSEAEVTETLQVEYFSAERIDISFDPTDSAGNPRNPLHDGNHDIEVTNPDGQFALLSPALNWDSTHGTMTVVKSLSSDDVDDGDGDGGNKPRRRQRFATVVSVDGLTPWGEGNAFPTATAAAANQQGKMTALQSAVSKPASAPVQNVEVKTPVAVGSAAATKPEEPTASAANKPAEAAASTPAIPIATAATTAAAATAAPTRDEVAELLKKHHPDFWVKLKDNWEKLKDEISEGGNSAE